MRVDERLAALAGDENVYLVSVSIRQRESSIQLIPLYTMDPEWSVTLQTSSIARLLDALDDVRRQCPKGGSRMEDASGVSMWIGRATA